MRLLLTGGCGYIGSHTAWACEDDESTPWEVHLLDDLRNAAGVIVIGVHDPVQGLVMVPQADMVFAEGCAMIVLGTREDLDRFHEITTG